MNCNHSQEAEYIACVHCDIEHAYGEGIAWESERTDRLYQIEKGCTCDEPLLHLKLRLNRSQDGIDYTLEFGDVK